MLTADRIRAVLTYDPITGIFRWKSGRPGWQSADRPAGNLDGSGRRIISIARRRYYASRLAWLYVHGEWPVKFIDHINLDKADDRIANLREATRTENAGNRATRADSSSGLKGASKSGYQWKSSIKKDGVVYHLGRFDTPLAAHKAYVAKAIELYGEFARAS